LLVTLAATLALEPGLLGFLPEEGVLTVPMGLPGTAFLPLGLALAWAARDLAPSAPASGLPADLLLATGLPTFLLLPLAAALTRVLLWVLGVAWDLSAFCLVGAWAMSRCLQKEVTASIM
jgi:hypothetical protein